MEKDLDNKIDFQFGLEINSEVIAKQELEKAEAKAKTYNKVLMPKIEAIVEWHQVSEDKHLMPNVIREILFNWYMSSDRMASNWIRDEFDIMKSNV